MEGMGWPRGDGLTGAEEAASGAQVSIGSSSPQGFPQVQEVDEVKGLVHTAHH